jgi:cytoskeleton protein RodZ
MKTGPRVSERVTPLVGSCVTCGALLDGEHLEGSVDGVRCEFCGALQEWAKDEGPRAPAPVGVGDTLRKAREARKESLEHAASETHIHERFLRSLEDDEPSDAYPGAIYGRFFLRGYAEHLGLDEGPLLEAYDLAASEEDSALVIDGALPKDHSRGNGLITAIATIALLVVAGLSWWAGGRSEEASAARIPVLSTPSSPAHVRATPPVEGEQPPVTPPGVRAIVSIVAPCWVQAVVDGRTLEGQTLRAGTQRSFRADRTLELTFGNPAGARVWVNGRRVQTGPSDQVAHLSYTWRHGRLVGGRV